MSGPSGNDQKPETSYSPGECNGVREVPISGKPDARHVSTAYAEANNLTMRMGMRRCTRLTNAFSKKVENLQHALAIHFMHHNFCRKYQTLKTTPAVAVRIADYEWSVAELIGLLVEAESN